jgi:endonuclease III
MISRTPSNRRVRSRNRPAVEITKRPFDIDLVMRRVAKAVRPFAKAALFDLAEQGFTSPFEQLVACIISIRTLDQVTVPTAQNLFHTARTPAQVARLSVQKLDGLIRHCSFHEEKATTIRRIATEVVKKHAGALPCDAATLLSLPGVGPKCANLVLGIACGQARIAVDIHVHRVTNRWGYVQAGSPEQSMRALESKLPKKYWLEINSLLVPFGKHICTGTKPRCSSCPLLELCRQVGVTEHR